MTRSLNSTRFSYGFARRSVSYITIGLGCYVVDVGLFGILIGFTAPLLANAASYGTGFCISYTLNRLYTFKGRHLLLSLKRYLAVNLFGFIFSQILLFLAYSINLLAASTASMIFTKSLVSIMVALLQYILNTTFSVRARSTHK
jgi:putative flippase GtrA